MIVYEFIYNPCYHESIAGTVSIHATRKGAEIALSWHQHESYLEYLETIKVLQEEKISTDHMKFGDSEFWVLGKHKWKNEKIFNSIIYNNFSIFGNSTKNYF